MAGRNYLEEMRFKKQPKPQPNIQFRIDKPKTKNPVGKKTSTTDEPGSPLSFDDKPSTDKPRRPTLVPSSGVLANYICFLLLNRVLISFIFVCAVVVCNTNNFMGFYNSKFFCRTIINT